MKGFKETIGASNFQALYNNKQRSWWTKTKQHAELLSKGYIFPSDSIWRCYRDQSQDQELDCTSCQTL